MIRKNFYQQSEEVPVLSAVVFLIVRIAMAVILFAFLGWALWLQWKDLQQQAKDISRTLAPPIILTQIVEASHADFVEPHSYRYTNIRVMVGRDPACECLLEDKTISGQHAQLSYHLGQWWVEDLGSTNGTYLNQDVVKSPLVLTTGDQLRFGQLIFQVSIDESPDKDVRDTDFIE